MFSKRPRKRRTGLEPLKGQLGKTGPLKGLERPTFFPAPLKTERGPDPTSPLLTSSFLISENLLLFLDFPSDRSTFSTFVGGYQNAAIAEKREENPAIRTDW